tara:strand:- start:550 stop:1011 length:462 start_codon:yes stop_codon:yes gene_type:complete
MNFTNLMLTLLTVSSVCEKHNNFEEVYTGNKIKCSKDVKKCPKSIVVKAKNVNRNSTFKFVPATDSKQKLQYTIHIDWCDDYTFDKSLTYVKVRKHTIDGGESIILLLAIIIALMFCCCTPDSGYGSTDNVLLWTMLCTNNSSGGNWGGANDW